ncbi:MAG: GyrI-like domain-containing protein [Candidatus Nealsonbacteria bacterium]|nr:GyrI-like domain-containing protein [Candidatus Nealsonbacteria bacterium]
MVMRLERQKAALRDRVRHHQNVVRSLEQIILSERETDMNAKQSTFNIEEKTIEPTLVASVRMTGRYDECGRGFSRIGRALGRHVCGKPLCLYYDGEYKEDDADFEPCMPVRQAKQVEGISIRELSGGRCVSLIYQGPYGESGHHKAYQRIFEHVKQRGYRILLPSREVFLKGPGMVFRGNPKKYLTEIQVMVETAEATC